ncbi:MAG TPA: arsenical efflux pump membrane protein ArsB [Paenibacillaceae bacterium]|nr:arsenical efflux pump membrane protein ArsB [Paenibacillaceae bacterium]
MKIWIAVFIFVFTVTLVIWQPKGLKIGWSATGGALLALLFGVVTWADVGTVTEIVWNATLAFIGIILISLVLDEIGFFEWAALHMARLARGNTRWMFVYILVLGSLVSAFFANDGAALILTPIVLAMVRTLNFQEKTILPFVMASGFIADTTSLPFTISNLTNIVSADFFEIGFAEYALHMVVPNMISFLASLTVLYLFFHKSIPNTYSLAQLKEPKEALRDPTLFHLSWVVLGILFVGYLVSQPLGVPVSFIVGGAAVIFVGMAQRSKVIHSRKMVKEAPWQIIIFSIGMYLVVFGLRNAGLTNLLGKVIERAAEDGIYGAVLGMGFLAAFLSSVMNNLPSIMIGALAIDGTVSVGAIREALAYANVIGCDLGPKITPIGSLATLIWLHILSRKGIHITWGYYFKVGFILTLPTLFITLLGLGFWLKVI